MKQALIKGLRGSVLMLGIWSAVVVADGGQGAEPARRGDGHHPDMQAAEARFHDLMEPHWHSSPGPERMVRVCDQVGDIAARVQAMVRIRQDAPVLGKMTETATRLNGACLSRRVSDVDGALDALHRQFHELMGMH